METIRTERLVLVDSDGRERGELAVDKGAARLKLSGPKGCVWIGVLPDGSPAASLLNDRGKPLIELRTVEGQPFISLYHDDGSLAITHSVTRVGDGCMSVFAADGRRVLAVGADREGVPSVWLQGRKGQDVAVMCDGSGSAGLMVRDGVATGPDLRSGEVIGDTRTEERDGTAFRRVWVGLSGARADLSLSDPNGRVRVSALAAGDAGHLRLFSADGSLVWTAQK